MKVVQENNNNNFIPSHSMSYIDNQKISRDNIRLCVLSNVDSNNLPVIGEMTFCETAKLAFSLILTSNFDAIIINANNWSDEINITDFAQYLRRCGNLEKSKIPIIVLASSNLRTMLNEDPRYKTTGILILNSDDVDVNIKFKQLLFVIKGRSKFLKPKASNLKSNFVQNINPEKNQQQSLMGVYNQKQISSRVVSMKDEQSAPQDGLSNLIHQKDSSMHDSRKGFLERLGDIVLARIAKQSESSNRVELDKPDIDNKIILNAPSLPVVKGKQRMEAEIDKVLMEMGGSKNSQNKNVVVNLKKKQALSGDEEAGRSSFRQDSNNVPPVITKAVDHEIGEIKQAVEKSEYISPGSNSSALLSMDDRSSNNEVHHRLRLSDDEKSKVYERVRNLISNAKQSVVTPEKPVVKATRSLSICFLDDSRVSSQIVREMLSEFGHDIVHFSSAEDVLISLQSKKYDLILANQITTIRSMDCPQLLRSIRASEYRQLPIVVLTSDPASANIRSLIHAGADRVVIKPTEGKELNARILETFELRKKQVGISLKICFLEDSCTSSQAIREALSEHGHTVEHFSSAEEAFDAILEKNYDALLASQIVALGGMDCETLISSLKNSSQKSLPVIALTTNANTNNLNLLISSGAKEVIVKPVEGRILNDRILRAVEVKLTPSLSLRKSLSICFLEDSCTSSQAIREMLSEQGHLIDHFSSAEEALDATLEKKYDVLLASEIVAIGNLDCEGLIRSIKKSDKDSQRTLPIVVLTTNANLKSHHNYMAAGAYGVVVKPVEAKELNARILAAVSDRNDRPTQDAEKWRICFLEDSCTSSQAIREILGEHGHEIDHFSSPEEAYDALMEKDYDLVLASQVFALGSLDSEGLIRSLRTSRQSNKNQIPIVVLTANADPQNIDIFFKAGANEVLIKPVKGNLNQILRDTLTREFPRAKPKLRVVSNSNGIKSGIRLDKVVSSAIPVLEVAELNDSSKFVSIANKQNLNQEKLPPARRAVVASNTQKSKIKGAPNNPPQVKPSEVKKSVPIGEVPIVNIAQSIQPSPVRANFKKNDSHKITIDDSLLELMQSTSSNKYNGDDTKGGESYSNNAKNLDSTLSKKLRVATIAGVLGVLGFGIFNWMNIEDRIAVQMVAVEQGPLFQTIKVPGRVVSRKKVEITSAVAGQIVGVSSKEGDFVTKGTILARLDDSERRIQFEQADAKLESAKKDVALTERTLDRLVRALQMGAVSRQMAEDAEAAVHAARAKMRVAAEELRAAQLSLDKLNIVAPFDGIVTAAFAIEGLWAEPPGPLFTLVDMRQREAELKVDAADSNSIRVGQAVLIASDSAPGQQWKESVVRVASTTNKDDAVSNTFNVYVSLNTSAPELRFGQQIDAEIRTATSDNATKVPFGAIVTREGRTLIAIVENGEVQFQPVTTGIEDLTHVQIVSGLKPGQKIIMLNKELKEGQKVEPVATS